MKGTLCYSNLSDEYASYVMEFLMMQREHFSVFLSHLQDPFSPLTPDTVSQGFASLRFPYVVVTEDNRNAVAPKEKATALSLLKTGKAELPSSSTT